jgi:hypothetical protein
MISITIITVIIIILIITVTFKSNFENKKIDKFKSRFTLIEGKTTLGVDMVYAITMPQRKEYITKQINQLELTCKYFDAIKPTDLSTDDYNNLSDINSSKSNIYNKTTRLPVLLSIIMCFLDAIENNYKTIIVFEDDIKIVSNKTVLTEGIQEFKNSSCDIFYMGYCYMNCNQLVNIHKYKNIVEVEDRNILCCHSLCIKTEMLPDLIDYCFPMINNSDELFRNYFMLNNIKVCVPRQAYFIQNRNDNISLNESYNDDFKTCNFKIQ